MEKNEFLQKLEQIRSSFEGSKNKIGARDTHFALLNRELVGTARHFNMGGEITGAELERLSGEWASKDPLVDENGNPFVLFISDFSTGQTWGGLPKFHFTWCSTLESMSHNGRFKRYIKKNDIENNNFKGKDSNDRDKVARLDACLNCKSHLAGIYPGVDLFYNRTNMDIVRMFEMFGPQKMKDPNQVKPYSVQYPQHWREISQRLREQVNWQCQNPECNNPNCIDRKGYLDVHHKNGVKSDTSRENLEVLCKNCHANQFGHAHYRQLLGINN